MPTPPAVEILTFHWQPALWSEIRALKSAHFAEAATRLSRTMVFVEQYEIANAGTDNFPVLWLDSASGSGDAPDQAVPVYL